MKISYNWLQQFLKIDLEAEQVAEILTDLGLEVEGIEKFESVKGSLDGIVVGEVLTCEQHPNADRLKVTTVDVGLDKPLSIVCGAPNVAAGQKVPVALIGTTLYSGEGEPWVIKKGKIRGEESHGMICAEDELGLGTSHDGIMVLDNELKVGTPAATVFEIFKDEVFEIGLTPNRADAMSHMGVARDLRAGLMQQYDINKELITPSVGDFNVDERTFKINVEVEDYKKAPRYAGVTLINLTVAESPDWLKNRLLSIGQKPINNVVDVTNFVLHALGQPLHAFDTKKIEEEKIVVKCLPSGTKFKTLDGIERVLHEDDIMICDGASNPMCLAGIFGGELTGVTNKTTSIFLESAYFDPISIRKSAKRHGLNTDASFRFERGIDPENVEYALKLAAILIKKVAGGKIVSDVIDIYPKKIQDFQVHLSYEKANRLIGEEIPSDTIKNILASLDIKINNQTESGLGLTIPSYRVDVQREADIVEDILRVYGYNNISSTTKLNTSLSYSEKLSNEKIEGIISSLLIAQGFSEMMANSLTKAEYIEMLESLDEQKNVKIVNALSKDLEVMRQSLLFGSLEAVAYNINRKNANIKLFELGKSYHKTDQGYQEKKHLTLTVSGERNTSTWNSNGKPTDFFYVKGICEAIFQRLGITDFEMNSSDTDIFFEGVSITKNDKRLLELGLVNEKLNKHFGIKQEVWFADFFWEVLMEEIGTGTMNVVALPKYPEVKRDLALLLDQTVQFKDLYNTALSVERKLLKKVELFDVYTGDKLPKGKKSYALSFVLRDDNKTLTDKQIDKIMGKLQESFKEQFEAELR